MSAAKIEIFKRTDTKEMNKQNAQICIAYEAVNFALLELMKIGVTVLRITIEGSTPLIEIMPGKGCRELESYVFAIISKGVGRTQVKRAIVHHCRVQWESDIHR